MLGVYIYIILCTHTDIYIYRYVHHFLDAQLRRKYCLKCETSDVELLDWRWPIWNILSTWTQFLKMIKQIGPRCFFHPRSAFHEVVVTSSELRVTLHAGSKAIPFRHVRKDFHGLSLERWSHLACILFWVINGPFSWANYIYIYIDVEKCSGSPSSFSGCSHLLWLSCRFAAPADDREIPSVFGPQVTFWVESRGSDVGTKVNYKSLSRQ